MVKQFGKLTAVNDLSLEIRENEIFGLLGPNGAGKTTTINIMCGLLEPTGGSISYKGTQLSVYKSLIGYCPQENIFYPRLTCSEQLVFIGKMYGLSTQKAAERAGNLLSMLGLTDKSGVRADHLSGGMKRRLGICLALIHDPEIVILDEPEAGLDPQSRVLVRDFIRHLGTQKTVILTTHNMDEADRLAHRIAIIDYGRLLMLDTPHNLKKTVGEGDVLEIIPVNGNSELIDRFVCLIAEYVKVLEKQPSAVLVKHPNLIEVMPVIKQTAMDIGLPLAEIRLRENTLEDVFIHLTGRNLR